MAISYDDVRNLPLPNLSVTLLRAFDSTANFHSLTNGFKQREGFGHPGPPDMDAMLARLSDAWA